jgi:hypothetical protein
MDRRSFLRIGGLAATGALIGCGPPWHVIVQAAPSPFMGQRKFAVQPVDFSTLRVGNKPEPVYLAEKDEKQRASFAEDKAQLNNRFLEAFREEGIRGGLEIVPATGPADAPFTIRPAIPFIEPGFYVGIASAPSRVEMNVRILTPDGRILDEIALIHGTAPSLGITMSSGGRLRSDGEGLGRSLGQYMELRVVGRG